MNLKKIKPSQVIFKYRCPNCKKDVFSPVNYEDFIFPFFISICDGCKDLFQIDLPSIVIEDVETEETNVDKLNKAKEILRAQSFTKREVDKMTEIAIADKGKDNLLKLEVSEIVKRVMACYDQIL